MMVTFVSLCEKKALPKTRRILDSFASRIGSRTWQSIVTEEGLTAIKKLLRQSATKSTAVSCHWIRSRSRSELLWVVGNRSKFNEEGIVPVNSTRKDVLNTQWENDWYLLPHIKSLVAVAALFHDWGKASEWFQSKLTTSSNQAIGDPLRHEWISVLFLSAFVQNETDEQWITRLAKGEFDKKALIKQVQQNESEPIAELPPIAMTLAWLILTHHRMPMSMQSNSRETALDDPKDLFKYYVKSDWQYQNKFDENEYKKNLKRCLDFPVGLPSDSTLWLKAAKKWGKKLLPQIETLQTLFLQPGWRWLILQAKLSLMLGDHHYSSQNSDKTFQPQLKLYANTKKINQRRQLDQSLEEHLLGVMKQSLHIAHHLPMFESNANQLPATADVRALKKKSPTAFRWQDIAVAKLKDWRQQQRQQSKRFDEQQFGFFAVNMASTGKGKTFANAKIMRALSQDEKSLRYILALGLRTLTLQTGDEYRQKIGLSNDELAVLIGSRAIQQLHEQKQLKDAEQAEVFSGSESEKPLTDDEVFYDSPIPEGMLQTVLANDKQRALLYAPVLVCTIDHIMGATETTRGGRYILPSLRLMSSDLVIDEIDDFVGSDLIAIGRLIHLAGLSGRKVMISSATIPPDLAQGFFNAYQAGWQTFAQAREKRTQIGCAWTDEFVTQVHSLAATKNILEDFAQQHQRFIEKRLKHLQKQPAKRKANIIDCDLESWRNQPENTRPSLEEYYFSLIQQDILQKHQWHSIEESKSGKCISFGVVRMANIDPCIRLTRYLLNADWPDDVDAKCMAYHSRQILIMRNAQEKHLDELLKRNDDDSQAIFQNGVVQQYIRDSKAQNLIFILVASPVEEVGRDHDFDWAILEPSSLRSIIQMAGRVLRHREIKSLQYPNIGLLQYNLKGVEQVIKKPERRRPVFNRPGFEEDGDWLLNSHNLQDLIDANVLAENLDASLRINHPKSLQYHQNLADLEHAVTQYYINHVSVEPGPDTHIGWFQSYWWLTALPQLFHRFRQSAKQEELYLMPDDTKGWVFKQRNEQDELVAVEGWHNLTHAEALTEAEQNQLWLNRDYQTLLEQAPVEHINLTAAIYGQLVISTYGKELSEMNLQYNPQLGLERIKTTRPGGF